jgi:two-component system, OmpR family, sensor histidine kinase BaeS
MPFRLDTLRVKLFIAIAGANVVLVMAAYLIYGWSFDQGLGEYLNRTETARLDPLVSRLAEGYRQNAGWDWLTHDRAVWTELVREELGGGRTFRRGSDERGPRFDGPTGLPPLTIDPRLLVLDADGNVLIGFRERAAAAVRKPVLVDGRAVGYLAYVPRLQMVESLERVFSAQQGRRFGAIAIGLLAAVLVNAALISMWLARRLRALSGGATALSQGHYETRIPVHGDDELARLAGDFNRLASTLEAAQNARRQWIADIAHELRTPIATLRAEIEALEDGVRAVDARSLGSLAQEVGQLTRLVEDLRLLSLSDLGALTYRKERVALAECIEDCLASQRNAILDKPLDIDAQIDGSVHVSADPERLVQVFANLLQNTLRYTDAPARLRITLDAHEGRARVVWADSSPGVPEAELHRLTERLYRVDASRARSSGGTGLGLAIVKAIVEAHEGTLVASPSPLGGLLWTLQLPLSPETADG